MLSCGCVQTAEPVGQPLSVTQYHFTSWPDHGVPRFATALISFIRRVQKAHNKDEGIPLLVHCSAGVGRTGTFILLDSMLERIKAEKTVNVYAFLVGLRKKRVLMVQTLVRTTCHTTFVWDTVPLYRILILTIIMGHCTEACNLHTVQSQYMFVHDALCEVIRCGDTEIQASRLDTAIERMAQALPGYTITGFQEQFQASALCIDLVG